MIVSYNFMLLYWIAYYPAKLNSRYLTKTQDFAWEATTSTQLIMYIWAHSGQFQQQKGLIDACQLYSISLFRKQKDLTNKNINFNLCTNVNETEWRLQ